MKSLFNVVITTKFHINSAVAYGDAGFPDFPALKLKLLRNEEEYLSSGKYYSDRDNADVALRAIVHMLNVKKNVVLRDEFDLPIVLEGDIYDDPRFSNDDHVVTSPVVSFNFDNDKYAVVQTKSGSVYKVVFRLFIDDYYRRYRGDNLKYYNKVFKEV